jgi:hypothetical protein
MRRHAGRPSVAEERRGHVVGVLALFVLFAGPRLMAALWPPSFAVIYGVFLVALPVAIWRWGPRVRIDSRAALTVAIPVLGLMSVIPFIWRTAHRGRSYPGAPEPPWGAVAWSIVGAIGVAFYAFTIAGFAARLTR